jgi:hypothetical protein
MRNPSQAGSLEEEYAEEVCQGRGDQSSSQRCYSSAGKVKCDLSFPFLFLCRFYGEDIRAYQILAGLIDRPPGCDVLYNVLDKQALIAAEIVAEKLKKKAMESARKSSESGFLSRFDFKVRESEIFYQ